MGDGPDRSYPPRYRLRRRPEILKVQRGGRRRRRRHLTVCLRPNELGHPRFGSAVSRKVGNAVVRNRVKRRLREVFRHLRPQLDGLDVFILTRPAIATASLQTMMEEITSGLSLPPLTEGPFAPSSARPAQEGAAEAPRP